MTSSAQWPTDSAVEPAAARRTSGLAIASLVLSAVVCCPVTTLLGVLLGAIAWLKVRSDPTRAGAGLALAAMVIGLAATIAQFSIGWWAWETMYRPVLYGPEDALTAAYAGDRDTFREQFSLTPGQASDAEIDEFAATLRERYGAFGTATLDMTSLSQRPPGSEPEIPAEYELRFSKDYLRAKAEFTVTPGAGGRFGPRIRWLEIIDPKLGSLRFPKQDPAGTPAADDVNSEPEAASAGGG